jgi:type I restriction enzyme M protein
MNQQLRAKLNHITNVLWAGGVSTIVYVEQLSYLIFLKLLDEEESDRELHARLGATGGNVALLYPAQSQRYRWSHWRFKSGFELRDFIRDEVFPYMASLTKDEPEVAEYFRDANMVIDDPNVLKEVIDELDSIEFRKIGRDIKGDIYEYLLGQMAKVNSAELGQYRTPRQIRAFMVEMLDPDFGDSIFDPSCGTAGFLIDAVDYLRAKYSDHVSEYPIYGEDWLEKKGKTLGELKSDIPRLQTYRKGAGEKIPDWSLLEASIYGTDVSRQMLRISMMNLVLHGIRQAKLKRANSLSDMGGLSEDDLRRRYKVILANPPFAGQLPKDSIRADLPTNSKKSELLFMSLMMQHLAPGGRCAVVVPEGLLFGSTGAHVELRKKLVHDFDLLAVVSLPPGVFKPYAGVKTAVLVFRKPASEAAKRLDKVWFYEVRNDGYDPDKISGGGRVETPDKNDIPDLLAQWKAYKASGYNTPPGLEANTLLAHGNDEPTCWWAMREKLAEADYNLGAGQWKPRIAEKASDEDPRELVVEVLEDYRKVVAGLERLLVELP